MSAFSASEIHELKQLGYGTDSRYGPHGNTWSADNWVKQDGKCGYCDQPLDLSNHHTDHLKPRSAGGTNDFENLVLVCNGCHYFKSLTDREKDPLTKQPIPQFPDRESGINWHRDFIKRKSAYHFDHTLHKWVEGPPNHERILQILSEHFRSHKDSMSEDFLW